MTGHITQATRVAYADRGYFGTSLDELTNLSDRWHAKTVTPVIVRKRWREAMVLKTLWGALRQAALAKLERERALKVARQARYREAQRRLRAARVAS